VVILELSAHLCAKNKLALNYLHGDMNKRLDQFAIFAAVFLLSFCGLTLQITLTRIFSATIWYHYAFIAVSVALFGWGFGGIFFYFVGRKIDLNIIYVVLSILCLIFSFSTVVFLWSLLHIPPSIAYLSLYYVISAIPFFLAGTCVAIVFHSLSEVSKIYFADLTGAAFGSLSVGASLAIFGVENAVILVGVVASIASLLFALASYNKKICASVLMGALLIGAIFVFNFHQGYFTITYTDKPLFRALEENPNLYVALTKWNSFSRIDVVEGYTNSSLYLAGIYIDASAFAPVLHWDGNPESIKPSITRYLDYLPYYIFEDPKVLIIGSGGGRDVVTALVAGSRDVVAVEYNPIIVDVVESYGKEAGNVYEDGRVRVFVDEGRSFISRFNEKFDLIELYKVDTWAAIQAGGYALSENYLYTVEAFEQYYDHLTDDGVLMVVRWRRELPRLVSIVVEVLRAKNVKSSDVGKHIIIIQQPNMEVPSKSSFLLLVKKSQFSEADSIELVSRCSSAKVPFHVPFYNSTSPYKELLEGSISLENFYEQFDYRVDAVSDDSPYYFSWDRPYPDSLQNLMNTIVPLTLAVALIPSLVTWKRQKDNRREYGSFIFYFSALGIGYMFVEIVLLQRFILFLGHPTRTLSVILFSLLLSSGIGSFVSGYVKPERIPQYVRLMCVFIGIIAVVYSLMLPSLFGELLSQPASFRIVVSAFLLFPLGFVMGMPFPLGMREIKMQHARGVSWMWGVNGVMSVIGSVVATAMAIMFGLKIAIFFGVLAYVIAFSSSFAWHRR